MNRKLIVAVAVCGMWSSAWGATEWSAAEYDLYPGDFDGDGKTDLLYVAKAPTGASGIARSDGNGPNNSTQTWLANYLGIPWHSKLYTIIVDDFNGDGKSDVFMQRNTPGNHYLLFADSNGKLTSISQEIPNSFLGLNWSADQHKVQAGDFNGDGRADLFLQGSSRGSTHAVILASATGQLTAGPQQTWTDASWGAFSWSVKDANVFTGDFNGDGRADLLLQAKPQIVLIDYEIPIPVPTYRPGMNGVVLSQGGSTPFQQVGVQQWNRNAFGADWSPSLATVVVGDFDGNGTDDVVLQARRGGSQSYLVGGNSSGSIFSSAISLAGNVSWSADGYRLLAGNFDGVGGAGIYWQAQSQEGTNYYANGVTGGTVSPSAQGAVEPAPIIPATVAGRTEGVFGVSSLGAATYRVPIWLPPGPRGLQPDLALTYNSQDDNGVIGVGWSLSGLSSIERCNKTKAQDGSAGSVALTTADRFCLNGNRLRLTSATDYGVAGSTYQTEIDDLTVVTAHESEGNGPRYFTARTRDGTAYEYGKTVDSRVAPGTSTTPYRWKLNRVTDAAGNALIVSYVKSDGHAVPATISWTPLSAGSSTFAYSANFIYTDSRTAADSQTGYVANQKVVNKRRLESIQIRAATSGVAQTVRRYFLTYDSGPKTGRSRLTQITECADDAQSACLAATTISYQSGTTMHSSSALGLSSSSSLMREKFDFNGDGRHDLLFVSSNYWRVALAVDGGFSTAINTNIPSSTTPIVGRFTSARQDALLANSGGTWWHYTLNESSTLFQSVSTGAPAPAATWATGDTNGDGLSDLVWVNASGQIYIRLNASVPAAVSPTFSATTTLAGTVSSGGNLLSSNGAVLRFSDVDGDGRQDLYHYYLPAIFPPTLFGVLNLLVSRDTTFEVIPSLYGVSPGPTPINFNDDACTDRILNTLVIIQQCGNTEQSMVSLPQAPILMMDWNDDGRTDFLVSNGSNFGVYLSNGQGVGPLEATSIPYTAGGSYFAIDQDGDGLDDIVRVSNSTPYNVTYFTRSGSGAIPVFATSTADLATSFTDGFGVSHALGYVSTARPNNSPFGSGMLGRDPNAPLQDDATARIVVGQVTSSDGIGGLYNTTYRYLGARKNVPRNEFVGYSQVIETDGRSGSGVVRKTVYEQLFPLAGMVKKQEYLQADGTQISITTNDNRSITVGSGASLRYFTYVHQSVADQYEVGGSKNGQLIATTTTSHTISPTLGVLTDAVTKVVEASTANGLQGGIEHVTELHQLEIFDDAANSCRGMPQLTELKKSSTRPNSTTISRRARITWQGAGCRPHSSIAALNTEWQVTSVFEYDDFGNIRQVSATPIAGQDARVTKAYWGSSGQFLEKLWNAQMNEPTVFGWNKSLAMRTSMTDPNALTTRWYPDPFGRIVQESRPDGTRTEGLLTACASGNQYCGAQSDVRLRFIATTYDAAGSLVRTDTQYFDAFGRLRDDDLQMLNGLTSRSITTYDAFGRVATQSVPHRLGGTDPLGNTEFGYDLLGRITTVKRQVSESDTSIATTKVDYLGLTQQVTAFQNDAQHQRITKAVRDALGQTIRSIDAASSATEFEYNPFGDLLTTRDVAGNEIKIEYYDAIGLKKKTTDPDMGVWEYKYYPFGELKEQKNANLQTVSFTYDKLSRPLTRTDSPGGPTTWYWDTAAKGIGQLDYVTSPGGYREGYLYDSHGRVRQQDITADVTVYSYQFDYNDVGLLNSITYPASTGSSPFKVRYGYAYGLMSNVQDYTANSAGTTYWQATAGNARGQITGETYGNGLQTSYGYDRIAGWLNTQTTGPSGGNSIQNLSYEWYKTGSLKNRKDLKRNLTEQFVYDALGRVDYSTLNGTQNADFNYDALGNLTYKTGIGTLVYDHAIKKHAVMSTTGTVNNSYEYDFNGNMTKRNGYTTVWYSYDLPKSIASAGSTSDFWYGPDRARWKQKITTGSVVETVTYLGGLMEKKVGTATEYRHLIQAATGTVAIHTRGAQTATYYLSRDHLGSVNAITNSTGGELVNESFDAFGQRRGSNWTGLPTAGDRTQIAAITSRGFTDHEHLDNLNLIHMNGRVYDPQIGRFTSADPFVQDPMNSQSLNRYSYTFNDPLSNVDPSGFTCTSVGFIFTSGGGSSADGYGGAFTPYWTFLPCRRAPGGPPPRATRGDVQDSTAGGTMRVLYDGVAYTITEEMVSNLTCARNGDCRTRLAVHHDCNAWPDYRAAKCDAIEPLYIVEDAVFAAMGGVAAVRAVMAGRGASLAARGSMLFGQASVKSTFAHGPHAGRTVGEVAQGLRAGTISADTLPIDYVIRNGQAIALNNRSLLALTRAGMQPTVTRNLTGNQAAEALLNSHLQGGVPSTVIRVRGGPPGTSLIE